jgi:hypothetical protein
MVVYSLEAKGYQTQDILQSIVQMEAHMAGKIYLMEARIVKNLELMQSIGIIYFLPLVFQSQGGTRHP